MKKQPSNFITRTISAVFGIFSETNPASLIRVMSFVMFFIATHITYTIIAMRPGPLGQYDFFTIIGLYSLAFFPKVIQKFMEKGISPNSYSTDVPYFPPVPAATGTVNYQNLQQ